ncbi:MAG TPA: 2-oxo-tetronate isomerase [Kiloniellales bacterium]|nr:2-oxo-tetronate isomerase [Kiloniellales bacterium]
MPRFAANLSFLFQELPFLDRFAAAAAAGFKAVEYLSPYDHAPEVIAALLKEHRLEQVLFNNPAGDWAKGERGISALPGREREFELGISKALDYAKALGCPRVHAMAGIVPAGTDRAEAETTYVGNLKRAAAEAGRRGVMLVIEPINGRDIPGFHLQTSQHAERVIEAVASAHLKLQLDLYHCQIMEGDLTRRIERLFPLIEHVQIASVPERHEPDEGEVNYAVLFRLLDKLGYLGWVGCEYKPRGKTEEGLGWMRTLV